MKLAPISYIMQKTEFPKAMYRAVDDMKTARNADEQAELEAEGYVFGHDFWKRYNEGAPKRTPRMVNKPTGGK